LSQTLAGCFEIIDPWPFSVAERNQRRATFVDLLVTGTLNGSAPARTTRAEYLDLRVEGGYPEAFQHSRVRRSRRFSSYVTTVVERFADDVSAIERLHELPMLMEFCAARMSIGINVASLANETAIPARTLSGYLAPFADRVLVAASSCVVDE
jgi:uncharacterized protein